MGFHLRLNAAAVCLCACAAGCVTSPEETIAPVRLEPRAALPSMPEMVRLTAAVVDRIKHNHVSPPKIDDAFSERVFNHMIASSDPLKLLLTAEDIESLSVYKHSLDDEIDSRMIRFPWLLSELTSRRAEEFLLFARTLIESRPDCHLNEGFLADRGQAAFPKNSEEQRQLWTAFIKNELIRIRIARIITQDSSLTLPGFRTENPYLFSLPESERILNRLKMFVHSQRYPPQRAAADRLLSAVASACDPHCAYNAPKDFERTLQGLNLTFAGIGVQFDNSEGICQVGMIVPGGPVAKQGGIVVGDILLTIAEENAIPTPLSGLPPVAISDLVRGPKGSKVRFTVLNNQNPSGTPREVTITREELNYPAGSSSGLRRDIKTLGEDHTEIAIVRLPSFYAKPPAADGHARGASDEVRDLLNDFDDGGGMDGVILDLRSNPGGFLPEAIRLAGLFIPKGPVVQIRQQNQVQVLNANSEEVFYDGPLVVLMDRQSASASEIVIGALKDYGRAVIAGDSETFGKGTVQQVIDMTQFSQQYGLPIPAGGLNLTFSQFYRVNGESTQVQGVPADIVIPSPTLNAPIGEAKLPNALPFNKVSNLKRQETQNRVTPYLSALSKASEKRVRANAFFRRFEVPPPVSDSEASRITVDFDTRLKNAYTEVNRIVQSEVQEAQRRAENQARKNNTLTPPSNDPVLEEAVAILKDLIAAERQKQHEVLKVQ